MTDWKQFSLQTLKLIFIVIVFNFILAFNSWTLPMTIILTITYLCVTIYMYRGFGFLVGFAGYIGLGVFSNLFMPLLMKLMA